MRSCAEILLSQVPNAGPGAPSRVNDGKGFLFVSHVGNVYPSGFLPIHAGNIRETPLAQEPCCIYQPRNWKPRQEGEPPALCQPEQSGTVVTL